MPSKSPSKAAEAAGDKVADFVPLDGLSHEQQSAEAAAVQAAAEAAVPLAVPEPRPSEAPGREVPVAFDGIRRVDF
jgi:hypothetical protein